MSNASTYLGGGAAIKSIQRGTTLTKVASTPVTVSAVDVSRSVVRLTDAMLTSTGTGNWSNLYVELTNSTTVTVYNTTGHTYSVEGSAPWELVEYAPPIKSIQNVSRSMLSVAVEGYQDVAISAVDPAKSIVEYRGITGVGMSSKASAVYKITAALTSATNLRVFNRSDKAGTAIFPTAYFTIVEFF